MTSTSSNRPELRRKASKRSERARQESLDRGVAITVNGKKYTLTMGDVTGVDAKAFREQVGVPFMKVMHSESDWDVDWIAGVVWLARRLGGERMLKYAEVAAEIGYDTDVDFTGDAAADAESGDVVDGEVVDNGDDPEASAGSS